MEWNVMAMMNIVAYDVQNNNNRAKIAARLQAHGNRIQRSVFLITIEHSELDTLIEQIEQFMDYNHDSLIVLRQCQTCWSHAQLKGQIDDDPDELCWTVM